MTKLSTLITALVMTAAIAASASATSSMSKEEIVKLPQERVEAIRQLCARRWGHNYEMRVYCEDEQYRALKTLMERGL
jgi:hypothetical protein